MDSQHTRMNKYEFILTHPEFPDNNEPCNIRHDYQKRIHPCTPPLASTPARYHQYTDTCHSAKDTTSRHCDWEVRRPASLRMFRQWSADTDCSWSGTTNHSIPVPSRRGVYLSGWDRPSIRGSRCRGHIRRLSSWGRTPRLQSKSIPPVLRHLLATDSWTRLGTMLCNIPRVFDKDNELWIASSTLGSYGRSGSWIHLNAGRSILLKRTVYNPLAWGSRLLCQDSQFLQDTSFHSIAYRFQIESVLYSV